MSNIIEFINVVTELDTIFDSLNTMEQKKLDCIAKNEVHKLDVFLKDEQVFTLQLRGLDKKREKIQSELSLTGLSFREIINQVEDEHRETLRQQFENLNHKVQIYKSISESSKKIIENHLHGMNVMLTNIELSKNGGIYDNKGEKNSPTPNAGKFTSRRI